MSLISSTCQKCGGQIEFDATKTKSFCVHCGSKIDVKAALQTVKLDTSEKTKNLISLLEKAIESGNNKKAETYAEQILEIDQSNARVWYLRGSAIIWQSTLQNSRIQEGVASYLSALKIVENTNESPDFTIVTGILEGYLKFHTTWFNHVCNHFAEFPGSDDQDDMLIREYNDLLDAHETVTSQVRISMRNMIEKFAKIEGNKEVLEKYEEQEIEGLKDDLDYLNIGIDTLFFSIERADMAYDEVERFDTIKYSWEKKKQITLNSYNVISNFSKKAFLTKENLMRLYKKEIELRTRLVNLTVYCIGGDTWSLTEESKKSQKESILEIEEKIKVIDPNYQPIKAVTPAAGSCYIATMVYGDYDAPQVKILRNFRDTVLRGSIFGRVFIKIYYFISPKLIAIFGKQKWFGAFWKKILDSFIIKLK
jgi:DNA-directed RNA polymerase subunit RPC12/RpoP